MKTIHVSVIPFNQVSEKHAYKEGEGDRTLAYWQDAHRSVFGHWFEECGKTFRQDSLIVLEEFEVVYPKSSSR